MKTVRHIGVLDDEIIAVRGMVFQLEKLLPQAEVKGFTQYREFELWCVNNAPELVFLDMEMPHAMGLDVAKRIQPDVGNIVFVTAHSHYSLEAFETAWRPSRANLSRERVVVDWAIWILCKMGGNEAHLPTELELELLLDIHQMQ